MRASILTGALVLSCCLFGSAAVPAAEYPAEYPGLTVPDGLGVNIHFTDPRPGEMEMLAAAGCRWVRMDFAWGGTEREKGKYQFSAYDRLLAAQEKHEIRCARHLVEREREEEAEQCNDKCHRPAPPQGCRYCGKVLPGDAVISKDEGNGNDREVDEEDPVPVCVHRDEPADPGAEGKTDR